MSPNFYTEFYFSNNDPQFALAVTVALVIYGAVAFVGLLSYIFGSIGYFRIAKRRGIHHPWLAWIPVGRKWLLGCISDQYRFIARNERKNRRKWLLAIGIVLAAAGVASSVSVSLGVSRIFIMGDTMTNREGILALLQIFMPCLLNGILSIAMLVFTCIALFDLYNSCSPNSSVVLLVLGILFGFLVPFFVFAVRNKDGGMPPRKSVNNPNQPQWNPGGSEDM